MSRQRPASLSILLMGSCIILSLLLTAYNNSNSTSSAAIANPAMPTVTAPKDLLTLGTLTVGSDTTYPPQEFIDTATGQATGFDIDLITAIAQRMGLKATIVPAGFDTIIDSLNAKRFDVVISAVAISDERKQKADFVPYFNAGASLLVQKGNPKHIDSTRDLCGLNVGVQKGTVEQDYLTTADKACRAQHKAAINLTILQNQTDVVQLLATGRVAATYQDSPITDYYLQQNAGRFDVGGSVVNAVPEGIAIRKGDTAMFNAVQTAFNQLQADGTYRKLFKKWGITSGELPLNRSQGATGVFRWDIFWQFLFSPFFLRAAWTTLWISVVAQFLGIVIGLFLALMRMSRFPFLNWPARAYIWFFRGSPLLVQVLVLFDGLPRIPQALALDPRLWQAFVLGPITVVLIAFSLNEGAYMAEIIRAGITSVDVGQMEAAKSLGMRYALAMRRIILPQAARVIVPPLGNEFNNMLKTTSIASVIGLLELTNTAQIFGSPTFTTFELLLVATLYYLLLTTLWSYVQAWIEKRLDPNRTSKLDLQKKGWTQRMLGFGSADTRGAGTLVSGH
ncbi:MAG: ABC transporter permease subunit [Ktedonobacteraceae bacterium]|nr:ABC transporter permease subunit [Ktedonobacteraceae bacterium]